MRGILVGLTMALALSGCASSVMNGYVGLTLQQVMVKQRAPDNAFDMGDGRRAFQWVKRSTYVTPTNVSNSGNVYGYGNTAFWTQNTQISGGVPITSECAYTMYGRWSDTAKTWVMEGYEKPNFMCE